MIQVVQSLVARHGLIYVGQTLRNNGYSVSDVWAEIEEIPTGGSDLDIDNTWYSAEVIKKLADMYSGSLVEENDIIIYDRSDTIIKAAVLQLYRVKPVQLIEFHNGDLYHQGTSYQPLDLITKLIPKG